MPATLETRKAVSKLTTNDFRAFPVWEFATDEESMGDQNETWVRPVDRAAIRKGAYSQIVASDFVTATGKKLQGFMIVTTTNRRVQVDAGAVVGTVGYRVLPQISRKLAAHRKAHWVIEERNRLLLALGQREVDVFPLRYTLRVAVRGEKKPRQGVLR